MRQKITARFVKSLQPQPKPYEIYDTELTGFTVRVQPSGYIGYYLFYWARDGRKRRFRLGPADRLTVAQARDLAQKYAARVVTGEDVQNTKQQKWEAQHSARLQTLEGFLNHSYEPWLLAERPEKTRSVATLKRIRGNFSAFLDMPLTDITPWVVEKWRADQRKQGKTPAAINRDVTALRAAISKAVTWGVINEHPLAQLKPLKVDTKARIRYLFEDEEERLRTVLERRDDRIKAGRIRGNAWGHERGYAQLPTIDNNVYGDHLTPMVLLTLNTGLRRGEAFNLKWKDINFATKVLTVEGTTAKSGQTRHISLDDEAMEVLIAWRAQTTSEGLVFPGKDGQRLDNVRKSWAGVLRTSKITGFRWHDLRHAFASKLVMEGVPLNTVRELLGHTTLNTTLRYAHLAPDHKAEAVARLNKAYHARATILNT
jgi:integrase